MRSIEDRIRREAGFLAADLTRDLEEQRDAALDRVAELEAVLQRLEAALRRLTTATV